MPTCIIEYAKELEEVISIPGLVESTHQTAYASGLFEEQDIKTRAIPFTYYQIGREKKPFIHISLKILPGRTIAQKTSLSQGVIENLKTLELSPISLTVEVIELEKESYSKIVI